MSEISQIQWSGPAIQDLKHVVDFVKKSNPANATVIAEKIIGKLNLLIEFPLSGQIVPEFRSVGYRQIIVYPYRIIYEVKDNEIFILRIWHGKRDLSKIHLDESE